jgi:quercetin dioxygenase-like cupin family protein
VTHGYSSADFAGVSARLTAELPARLIHKSVLSGNSAVESQFTTQRRHLVRVVDLPSKVISMTIGGLEPGQSSRLHRHNYETLIYFMEGTGRSWIGGQEVAWVKGDAIYVPVWAWHQHTNLSSTERALYLACENAPHLQNLGIALREEA